MSNSLFPGSPFFMWWAEPQSTRAYCSPEIFSFTQLPLMLFASERTRLTCYGARHNFVACRDPPPKQPQKRQAAVSYCQECSRQARNCCQAALLLITSPPLSTGVPSRLKTPLNSRLYHTYTRSNATSPYILKLFFFLSTPTVQ